MLLTTFVATTAGMTGCGAGDLSVAPPAKLSRNAAIGVVTLSPRNAIIAVGGTVDIKVSATSMAGEPITAFDSVIYQLVTPTDTIRVMVAQKNADTYTLTGRAPTTGPVLLNLFAYKNGTVQADQAFIHVTNTVLAGPLKLTMQPATTTLKYRDKPAVDVNLVNTGTSSTVMTPVLRFRVEGADSAKILTYRPGIKSPALLGSSGMTLSSEYTYFFGSLNSILAKTGEGTAYVYVDANVYGTVLRDSVNFSFIYPSTGTIRQYPGTDGYEIVDVSTATAQIYQSPAILTFQNFVLGKSVIISYYFDQPDKALSVNPGDPSGDVLNLATFGSGRRRFTTPGTYTFTAKVTGSVPLLAGQSYKGSFTIK